MSIKTSLNPFNFFLSLPFVFIINLSVFSDTLLAEQITHAQQAEQFKQNKQQANQLFTKSAASPTVPGLSVAVGNQSGIIWAQGFGYSNLENNVPMTAKTKLRVGSVAKVITAAGLMRLDQNNSVDFDAPIRNLVKLWPQKHPDISFRQLTNHTSGIRHYRGQEFLSNKEYASRVAALDIFKNDALQFPPGSKFSYSTYAWTLVSAAMEAHDQKRNFK